MDSTEPRATNSTTPDATRTRLETWLQRVVDELTWADNARYQQSGPFATLTPDESRALCRGLGGAMGALQGLLSDLETSPPPRPPVEFADVA